MFFCRHDGSSSCDPRSQRPGLRIVMIIYKSSSILQPRVREIGSMAFPDWVTVLFWTTQFGGNHRFLFVQLIGACGSVARLLSLSHRLSSRHRLFKSRDSRGERTVSAHEKKRINSHRSRSAIYRPSPIVVARRRRPVSDFVT